MWIDKIDNNLLVNVRWGKIVVDDKDIW